jgi:murein L,D-transpeptidase YcbB/YkuD
MHDRSTWSQRRTAGSIGALLAVYCAAATAETPARAALEQIVTDSSAAYADGPTSLKQREQVAALYAANEYRLLWSDAGKPTAAAQSLVNELERAADRGLDPDDYHGDRLASPGGDLGQWALFDARLTLAALRFLSDLHYGRIEPAAVGHNLTAARVELNVGAALAALSSANDVPAAVDALEPQFTHYALLKRQLARYRKLAAADGISALPPLPAKSLQPGTAYEGAAQLQRLLLALGDMAPDPANPAPPASLSSSLVAALKNFQRRHGERPDGVLGRSTYAELATPLAKRARQIELTMERWRWLPAKLESAPIIVNIPQFRLFAFESTADSEATIRQMDVIVGKAFEATETPVFTADMTYLIFRPYWEVPFSIALKEIVPAARRDPDSIERHQMELVRGTGDSADVMPDTAANVELLAKGILRLRQRPGPDNSLGLVKFMFPNPYNVYLHSTPAKALFAESRRDFSHGCVRVSDPVGLAEYVLRESPEWTREKILAAMNGPSSLTVTLKNKIRVFFVYGTALALENGDLLFFDDIYGHDKRLEAALDARRPQAVAPQAAAPATDGAAAPRHASHAHPTR